MVAVVGALSLVGMVGGCGLWTHESPSTRPTVADGPYPNEFRPDGPPELGGQLNYGLPSETNSFNPSLAQWSSYSLVVARTIFDFLATYDEARNIKPYLATSFEHDPGYTRWTVTLRDGVTFSNGLPLTAAAVVADQMFLKRSTVLSDAMARISSFEVTGRLTYDVHMSASWPTFPHAMATQIGAVAEPGWLSGGDILHPVGTGPFIVERWDVGNELHVRKNPKYWQHDTHGIRYPYLDSITFKIITDESARAWALRDGTIDVLLQRDPSPEVQHLRDAAAAGSFQAFSDERLETPEDFILVNAKRPPLDDPRARRALAAAIDRDDYVRTVTHGLNRVADGPYAPESPWHAEVDYPAYDPGEARRLVSAVRGANRGTFSVSLLAQPTPDVALALNYLRDAWAKVGIDVDIRTTTTQAQKLIKMVTGDFDLILAQQFDSTHPIDDAVFWAPTGKPLGTPTLQFSRLDDASLSQLAEQAWTAVGPEQEHQAVRRLQERQAELVQYVWLDHAVRTVVATNHVADVVRATLPDGTGQLDFIQGSHSLHQVWLHGRTAGLPADRP